MKFWTSTIAAVVAVAAMGGTAVAADHVVKMDKMKFVPETITIKKGDTVTWSNTDTQKQPHNATPKGNTAFKASKPAMMVGEKYTVKIDKAGSFDYTCTLHPGMNGKIVAK